MNGTTMNPAFDVQLLLVPLVPGFSSTNRNDKMGPVHTGSCQQARRVFECERIISLKLSRA